MASRETVVMRRSVTDPPVWRKPPSGASKATLVKLFRNCNPVFTIDEIEATLGPDIRRTVDALVSAGELKRQATGIFSRIEYDQSHSDVTLLIFLRQAKPTSSERLERQAARAVERFAAQQEKELRRRPATEIIAKRRAKVFSAREAWDAAGQDPRPAITQLLTQGVIHEIHPGLYRKRGVPAFGEDVLEWGERLSALRDEIARSIDASQEKFSIRDGRGPACVTGFRYEPKTRPNQRDRVRITFARMGAIQAVAGGPGNRYAAWQSHTESTLLTKDAAAFIAEQLFGRRMLWGDLLALAKKHQENPDKNPRTSETLPAFRRHSYLDYRARTGEREEGSRYTDLRRGKVEEGPMKPDRRCMLYVDHREDKRIVEALQGVENLHVAVVTLECGDFHAQWGEGPEDQIVIERKTGDDFQATIVHRDLAAQISRMAALARKGTRCFLLQQGDAYDVGPTQVDGRGQPIGVHVSNQRKAHSYAAMTLMGVHVVPVGTWQDAAKTILDLICYSMTPALLPWDADPRTAGDQQPAGLCGNQGNIAA